MVTARRGEFSVKYIQIRKLNVDNDESAQCKELQPSVVVVHAANSCVVVTLFFFFFFFGL